MIQFTMGPIMEIEAKNRHEDKLKEAELYRLINELRKTEIYRGQRKYPILRRLGRKLTEIGNSLEERHSPQSKNRDELGWLQ